MQSTLHLFVNKKVEEVEAADKTNQSVPDGTKPVALAISEGGNRKRFSGTLSRDDDADGRFLRNSWCVM